MRKVNKFTFCAILFAMLLVQPLLADIIPTRSEERRVGKECRL